MQTIILGLAAVAALAVAAYAQYRVPFHTQGTWNQVFLRLLLAAAGAGLGLVSAAEYQGVDRLFSFLCGFGVAHVPAAVILFIKRRRGVTR